MNLAEERGEVSFAKLMVAEAVSVPKITQKKVADIEPYHCTTAAQPIEHQRISESVKQGVIGRGTIFSNDAECQNRT